MSDCDTDSPDIHNKERREREGARALGEGEGEGKKEKNVRGRIFFFLWHIKSIAAESPTFWTYHIQEKSRKEQDEF